MPIRSNSPRQIPAKTFDLWYVTRFELYPDPGGPYRLAVELTPDRDTGEPLLDSRGNQQVHVDGTPRNVHELYRPGAVQFSEDFIELAKSKAAGGDTRFAEAMGLVMQLVEERARELGVIE